MTTPLRLLSCSLVAVFVTGCSTPSVADSAEPEDSTDTGGSRAQCGPEYVQEWSILSLRLPFSSKQPQIALVGGHILLSSGHDEGQEQDTIRRATLDEKGLPDGWVVEQDLPTALYGHAFPNSEGPIFLIGGTIQEKVLWSNVGSNGSVDPFSETTPLPTPVSWPAAIVSDTKLSVMGGWDASGNLSRGYWSAPIKDDGLGEWADLEPPFFDMVSTASFIATDEWFYIVGDEAKRAANIDGSPSQWESTTGTPGFCGAAALAGEHIYAAPCRREGYDWNSTFAATLDEDGVPHWERSADLPGLRSSGTLLASGPWLLLFGGIIPGGGYDPVDTIFAARYCEED